VKRSQTNLSMNNSCKPHIHCNSVIQWSYYCLPTNPFETTQIGLWFLARFLTRSSLWGHFA
jgi:hypothetical protein